MRTWILDLRIWMRLLGVSVRGQMQYPASFWLTTAGHLLVTGIEFAGVWALFERFGSLRGWRLPEVALLYGIVHVGFALAEGIGRGWDVFPALIRGGDFDRILLRPVSTALQVAGSELQLMRIGRLIQGAAVLGWAMSAAEIEWALAGAALVAGAVAGTACLFYGLLVLQATLAFWTIDTLEVMNTVTYGGVETAQYPLTIYDRWFRRIFVFLVPLASVTFLPATAVLGRPENLGAPPILQWSGPLAGVLFLSLCLAVWRVGVRHYQSTGS